MDGTIRPSDRPQERSEALFGCELQKLTHLGLLPQGQPERARRARALVAAADREGFGSCTLHGECEAACPKRIDVGVIARMNREYLSAAWSCPGSVDGELLSRAVTVPPPRGIVR